MYAIRSYYGRIMKYQISPDIKNKYNLAINSIAMVAIILVLNYFISLAINNSHTNVTNAISEKMSLAQKAKIDNDMVVNYIKKYGDNNDNALSYQGKLALIKQIEEKATSSGISDITWSIGAVIKSEINDYRLSGYKIYETPRITSYNVCYTKLLRRQKPAGFNRRAFNLSIGNKAVYICF